MRNTRVARRRCCVVVAMPLIGVSAPLAGQSGSPFPADDPLSAAAEHGRSFVVPSSLFAPPEVPAFRTSVGTSERACVEAPADMNAVVRSGEIFMGGGLGIPLANGRMKIWWNPQSAETPTRLDIFGQNLDDPSHVLEWSSDFATYASGDERIPANLFFPTWLPLEAPGRWVLVSISGASWGCFIVEAVERNSSGDVSN